MHLKLNIGPCSAHEGIKLTHLNSKNMWTHNYKGERILVCTKSMHLHIPISLVETNLNLLPGMVDASSLTKFWQKVISHPLYLIPVRDVK